MLGYALKYMFPPRQMLSWLPDVLGACGVLDAQIQLPGSLMMLGVLEDAILATRRLRYVGLPRYLRDASPHPPQGGPPLGQQPAQVTHEFICRKKTRIGVSLWMCSRTSTQVAHLEDSCLCPTMLISDTTFACAPRSVDPTPTFRDFRDDLYRRGTELSVSS